MHDVGDLIEVGIALHGRDASLLVHVVVGGDLELIFLDAGAVGLELFGCGPFERVSQAQRRTHAPADDQIFFGHLQFLPGGARGVQERPAQRAHVVEVVRVESRHEQLPQRKAAEFLAVQQVELHVGLAHVLEAAGRIDVRDHGLAGHAHGGYHVVFSVQHPLQRQIAFHHQAAGVGLQFLRAIQLQAAAEVLPHLGDPIVGHALLQDQPALGDIARDAAVDPLHAAVQLVHVADVQDRLAQTWIHPHHRVQILHLVFGGGSAAALAADQGFFVRQLRAGIGFGHGRRRRALAADPGEDCLQESHCHFLLFLARMSDTSWPE